MEAKFSAKEDRKENENPHMEKDGFELEDDSDSEDAGLDYLKDDEFFNDIFDEKKPTVTKPETVPKTKK